jgi:hypothetical protein
MEVHTEDEDFALKKEGRKRRRNISAFFKDSAQHEVYVFRARVATHQCIVISIIGARAIESNRHQQSRKKKTGWAGVYVIRAFEILLLSFLLLERRRRRREIIFFFRNFVVGEKKRGKKLKPTVFFFFFFW